MFGNLFHDNHVALRHKHAGRVHMEAYENRFTDNVYAFYMRLWSSDIHHNVLVRNQVALYLESDNMNANHDYRVRHNTFYATHWLVASTPDQGGFVANVHINDNLFMDPSEGLGVLHIGAFEWNWGTNDLSGWSMANNVFSYTPAARTFRSPKAGPMN